METLLACPVRNDYIDLAEPSAKRALAAFKEAGASLTVYASRALAGRPLATYTGRYMNASKTFLIDIQ